MTKKYNRPFTSRWRWLIAGASVSAFLGSWAIVTHTPNPYENSAAAAPQTAPLTQEAPPLPRTNRAPSQNSAPSRRQRQFQQAPSQNFDTAPQSQLPTTNQGRLRSGGS
ncbi:MAG: hypothetical protein B6D41_07150 [Chloroflexi bacterium UTCFX4]|jgi:hypothetical protein|nr:MAG: hypothetical protein B6D41_07150 [Chloroflexi bacterium UTCFX4]